VAILGVSADILEFPVSLLNAKQIWYRTAKSGLRAPLTRVRHWGLDGTDAFIASYPRSGNTWLRFLMFEILTAGSAGFEEVNHVVAEVGLHGPARPVLPGRGRLVKTHEPYHKQYKKAIYLVRDVRDVVLSEFAYQKALGWIPDDFDGFLQRFLNGEVNPFSAWHEHVSGWMNSPLASTPNLLLIKFEELRKNTNSVVTQVVDFLGVDVSPQTIVEAIANNTVQKMQEKEHRTPQLGATAPKANLGQESRFIRSGSIGGWRARLSPQQLHQIEGVTANMLIHMGYSVGDPESQGLVQSSSPRQTSVPQTLGQHTGS